MSQTEGKLSLPRDILIAEGSLFALKPCQTKSSLVGKAYVAGQVDPTVASDTRFHEDMSPKCQQLTPSLVTFSGNKGYIQYITLRNFVSRTFKFLEKLVP